jgi:hypothetical protein
MQSSLFELRTIPIQFSASDRPRDVRGAKRKGWRSPVSCGGSSVSPICWEIASAYIDYSVCGDAYYRKFCTLQTCPSGALAKPHATPS